MTIDEFLNRSFFLTDVLLVHEKDIGDLVPNSNMTIETFCREITQPIAHLNFKYADYLWGAFLDRELASFKVKNLYFLQDCCVVSYDPYDPEVSK